MDSPDFTIDFPGLTDAECCKCAMDLAAHLRALDPTIKAQSERESEETQDPGTYIALILGAASSTAVAKGIANWLARNSGVKIDIKAEGTIMVHNIDSRDVPKMVQALGEILGSRRS
jgi:hypothetical protein